MKERWAAAMVQSNLNASTNDAELSYSEQSFASGRAWLTNLVYSTSPQTIDSLHLTISSKCSIVMFYLSCRGCSHSDPLNCQHSISWLMSHVTMLHSRATAASFHSEHTCFAYTTELLSKRIPLPSTKTLCIPY